MLGMGKKKNGRKGISFSRATILLWESFLGRAPGTPASKILPRNPIGSFNRGCMAALMRTKSQANLTLKLTKI